VATAYGGHGVPNQRTDERHSQGGASAQSRAQGFGSSASLASASCGVPSKRSQVFFCHLPNLPPRRCRETVEAFFS